MSTQVISQNDEITFPEYLFKIHEKVFAAVFPIFQETIPYDKVKVCDILNVHRKLDTIRPQDSDFKHLHFERQQPHAPYSYGIETMIGYWIGANWVEQNGNRLRLTTLGEQNGPELRKKYSMG